MNANPPQTIVFVHGFGATADSWKWVSGHFSRSFKCICINMPRLFKGNDFSIEAQAQQLADFICEHNIKNAILVGHSFGGGISLILQGKNLCEPGVISAMVLIDSIAYPQKIPLFIKALANPISAALSRLLPPRFIINNIMETVFYDKNKIDPDNISAYADNMCENFPYLMGTAQQFNMEHLQNYRSLIRNIRIPTLIIYGAKDKIVPNEITTRLHSDIENSYINVIDNCGHAPQEECPDNVVAIIDSFLRMDHNNDHLL